MSKHPLNSHFSGTTDEFCTTYIGTEPIEKIISLLSLEPEKIAKEFKISEERTIRITIKEKLHSDIATIISFFSMPSQTQTETTHTDVTRQLKKYSQKIADALSLLESLDYPNLFEQSTISKTFKASVRIRQASKSHHNNTTAFASGFAKQSYDLDGEWPELYNFDISLKNALPELKKINQWIKDAENIKLGGKNEDAENNLLYGFCKIYKDYTGDFNIPNEQILGINNGSEISYTHEKVLQMLEILLPHTYYEGEMNRSALCKRIRRLKDKSKYKDLFS